MDTVTYLRRSRYVQKLVYNYDEQLKADASGMSLRPTTRKEVGSHLVGFGIIGDIADSKIRRLSGGQRSRLVLAAAMWSKPHFLALDEPTNYLDNDTLAALVHALQEFRHGGVIVISHNGDLEKPCTTEIHLHFIYMRSLAQRCSSPPLNRAHCVQSNLSMRFATSGGQWRRART